MTVRVDTEQGYRRPFTDVADVAFQNAFSTNALALVLRDTKVRQGVIDNKILRRAYLYVACDQSPQLHHHAQLQLNECLRSQNAAYGGQKSLYGC